MFQGTSDVQPVAFVTGSAGRRVGRVIADRFAALGYAIAIHGRSESAESQDYIEQLRRQNVSYCAVYGALEDEDRCEAMVREVRDRFGRIDILVNSAAIWSPTPLEKITSKELAHYFAVNATASFLLSRSVGLLMVQQESGGAIINVSDWALCRPYVNHAAYFPSKGAVEAMTRSMAIELGSRNTRVRVNCVAPGPVLFAPGVSEEEKLAVAQSTLLKRTGTPEHIAHAVQFLAENDFVTGVILPVDGGKTIYCNDNLQTGFGTG